MRVRRTSESWSTTTTPQARFYFAITTNVSKFGPVFGGVGVLRPIGVGGFTPDIGNEIVPPLNVPLATARPNMSCTLRTSYCWPERSTPARFTSTLLCEPQLYTTTSALPCSYLFARTNTCVAFGAGAGA